MTLTASQPMLGRLSRTGRGTARPEFRASWQGTTEIMLSPRNTRTMLEQVTGQRKFPEETVTAVVERTAGVPLFVEELTRAVLESGTAKLTGREIPATLHGSLMVRLDRLGASQGGTSDWRDNWNSFFGRNCCEGSARTAEQDTGAQGRE